MTKRRGFLTLIGGGVVLAAAATGGFVAANQPSIAARAPWRLAGRETEYRRRFLSYALLAPNPHNRQPWLVRLDAENALTLYVDLARRLPATDPYDRQITIGCGAFLELLRLAAAQEGYHASIYPFPDGEDLATLDARPVARVTFKPDRASPDALFSYVMSRRSNRNVYAKRVVPAAHLEALAIAARSFDQTARAIGDTPLAAQLRDLTWRAHEREVTTPRTNQESIDLMRFGAKEVAANPDGIVFEGPVIAAGSALGVINRKSLADPSSEAFKQGLAMFKARAMSARGFVWIANANATRADQIAAGRAYLRANLQAAALGVSMHPWSQALQEYPEMRELHEEAHTLIGEGMRLQMLARVGYGSKAPAAPRRSLDTHLIA